MMDHRSTATMNSCPANNNKSPRQDSYDKGHGQSSGCSLREAVRDDPLLLKPAGEGASATISSSSCSVSSHKTSTTCGSQDTSESSSASSAALHPAFNNPADPEYENELEKSRRTVRSLRREAKARASELARLRIQVEALSIEREGLRKYRDMCEGAMAECRDLRAERDELREIVLSVMAQEGGGGGGGSSALVVEGRGDDVPGMVLKHDSANNMRRPSEDGRLPSRRGTLVSEDSEDEHDDFLSPSFHRKQARQQQRWGRQHQAQNSSHASAARRPSLLEGVGGVFSSLVKNVAHASTKSFDSLGSEVDNLADERDSAAATEGGEHQHHHHFFGVGHRPRRPARHEQKQQRSASAVVTCGHASLTSIGEEEHPSAGGVEMDDMDPFAVAVPKPVRAARHSSMPALHSDAMMGGGGHDSEGSMSWNIGGEDDKEEKKSKNINDDIEDDDDNDSGEFMSWEESRRSSSEAAAPCKQHQPNQEQEAQEEEATIAAAPAPQPAAVERRNSAVAGRRGSNVASVARRRGSTGSVESMADGGGRRGSVAGSGRRRSSCFAASRRDTEKDVADFVASMMLVGGELSDLMNDAEIAQDFEE